jgi:hypothetical protein
VSTSITCSTTQNIIQEIFGRKIEDDTKYGKTTRHYIPHVNATSPHNLITKIRRLEKEKRKKYTST